MYHFHSCVQDKGWSALFFAYANEHIDGVAKLLLEYEADITLKDKVSTNKILFMVEPSHANFHALFDCSL